MIPILYADTEQSFNSNGIGLLADTLSAKVVQGLNGSYELELKYPLSGIHAASITDRCMILAKPDPVTDPQPFRIYRINPLSKGTIMVYARHLAYDLMGIPAAAFTASTAADAMNMLKQSAVVDCPFTFSTDKTTEAKMNNTVPKALWNLLGGSEGSVLDVYGGEYEFDRYQITLHSRRGMDRGVSIRYGKNLTTLEQDRNCSGCYTGVYPYWKPLEGETVQLPEKTLAASGNYNYTRILPLDLTDKFEEVPTEAELRTAAKSYMTNNSIGVPEVSWKVEFVQLEQTEEYKGTALLERVLLGDTVTVVFPAMNVNTSARAVEVDFDPILERYNSVTLGKVRASIADTIVKQQQALDRAPTKTAMAKEISQKLAKAMGVKGGCIRHLDTNADGEPDELYIADNPDPAQALKVWRFNYQGWAASKDGYNGPFILGATLEDGILAHSVTAAQLVAGTIKSKDGSFFVDLDNGTVTIKAISESLKDYVKTTDLNVELGKITASVSSVQKEKLDAEGGDVSDMGTMSWSLLPTKFSISAALGTDEPTEVLKVTKAGLTISGNGTFSGTVYASAGEFTGKITATSGSIGGFDILDGRLSTNGLTFGMAEEDMPDEGGIYIGPYGIRLGNGFRVNKIGDGIFNGKVYATDGEFKGKVIATSGEFRGTVYAEDGEFTGKVQATSGYFAGTVYAGNIVLGGENGTMSGGLLTGGTVSGDRLAAHTVSTAYTSDGINQSLGYADYANLVFGGSETASWGAFGNLSVGGEKFAPMTYTFKDGNGLTINIRCLGRDYSSE